MLPEHHIQWFEQLKLAAKNDDLTLMSCVDYITGEDRSVICMANRNKDGSVEFIHVGHLCPSDNPFEVYVPADERTNIQ